MAIIDFLVGILYRDLADHSRHYVCDRVLAFLVRECACLVRRDVIVGNEELIVHALFELILAVMNDLPPLFLIHSFRDLLVFGFLLLQDNDLCSSRVYMRLELLIK